MCVCAGGMREGLGEKGSGERDEGGTVGRNGSGEEAGGGGWVSRYSNLRDVTSAIIEIPEVGVQLPEWRVTWHL